METHKSEEKFNPWNTKDFDNYLFFCCPECSTKHAKKGDFIKHAWMNHPTEAKEMMESKAKMEAGQVWNLDFSNPWIVSRFEDFQFYFCPECDVKINTKSMI